MDGQTTKFKSAGFTGRSENKVDAKGRINIPAAFKRILAPNEHDEVVILYVPTGHLLLFNKEYWGTTIQQSIIDQAHIVGKENMWRTIHRLSEYSHLSTVDGQGRITIPGWLLEKARIEKDVITFGAFDRVSVWAPDAYKGWVGEVEIDSIIADIGLY
ncbi:division/cell wall cluster transcriptional repressor MraZ [Candidatus Latescibacterota bacterium]